MAIQPGNLQQPDPLKMPSHLPSQKTQNKVNGHVIILTGVVASGKSSIVRAIQKIDPKFHEEDLDLRRDPKIETTPAMETAMIDDTINRSLAGEKTVVSLLKANHLTRRMQQRGISDIPITTILAHCPFSEIPSRLDTRNIAAEAPGGDPENYRDPLVPLDQFLELYVPNNAGIEEIDRDQATQFFNTSFDKMIAHEKKGKGLPFTDEQIAKDKEEGCAEYLTKLGFTDPSVTKVKVAPRAPFDVVIDTSTCRDDSSREAIITKMFKNIV